MTIASLIVDVAANTVKLQQDVNKIQGSLDSVSSFAKRAGLALAGAFALNEIASGARKILDYAGKINDLSAQTGLTTRTIQQMQHAATVTGSSLDAFTNAAFKLGTNLAGGSSSVVGAVEKLGLSWFQLRQQSPDQQFNTITTALGGVQNAQERNKLAVELFGKAAKDILPAIAQGYDRIAESAIVAGDDQLQALDMAGDALDSFWEGLLAVSTQLAGGFIIAMREGLRLFESWVGIVGSVKKGLETWGDVIDTVSGKVSSLPKVLNEATVRAKLLPEPLKAISMSWEEQERVAKSLTAQVEKSIESKKEIAKADEKAKESAERFANSIKRLDTAEWFVPFKRTVEEVVPDFEVLASSTEIAARGMEQFKAAVQQVKPNVTTFTALGDSIKNLGVTILSAIQGGGSIVGSIGSSLGSSLGTDLVKNFGSKITGLLGNTLGGAVNAVLPGLGALLGPALEKVFGGFKKLFGIGANNEVKKYNAEIDKVRDTLLKTHGSLDQLEDKARAVGLSFRNEWGHQGQEGLRLFNEFIAEFDRRMADVNEEFSDLFGQAEAAGVRIPAAMQETIRHLIDIGVITGENAELFEQLAGQTEVDFERMQELAEHYGIGLADLGPQFQSARLHDAAQEIWNDFRFLTQSGADVGGVLLGMKDEIVQLALESVRFGVQIPGNFRPLIDNLLASNQLTEDEREALEALGDEDFGAPVESEFDRVTAAIERLIAKLELNLFPDLNTVPNPTVTVTTNVDDVIDDVGNLDQVIDDLPDVVPIVFQPEYGNNPLARRTVAGGGRAGLSDRVRAVAAVSGGGADAGAWLKELRAMGSAAASREAMRDRKLAKMIRDGIQKALA